MCYICCKSQSMLTQELRIFNYIDKVQKSEDDFNNYYKVKRISYNEHRNEETSVVDCFGNKHGYFSFLISDWQPVELTEEWLFKFGFEENKKHEHPFFDDFILPESEFTIGNFNNKYWIVDFLDQSFGCPEIKYVHQLQNLYYALTNTELTLKDEK